MAYEHETDEWRTAVRRSTEQQRYLATHAAWWAAGFTGDKYDACEGCHTYLDEEDDDGQ